MESLVKEILGLLLLGSDGQHVKVIVSLFHKGLPVSVVLVVFVPQEGSVKQFNLNFLFTAVISFLFSSLLELLGQFQAESSSSPGVFLNCFAVDYR